MNVLFKEAFMGIEDKIASKALELGLGPIGIIKPEALLGHVERVNERERKAPLDKAAYDRFRALARPKDIFPEAKSIIVLSVFMGRYRIPPSAKGSLGRLYLSDLRNNPGSPEKKSIIAFARYLEDQGLALSHGDDLSIAPMRWAAKEAGLGLIRRNNFFYTDKGSWNQIYAFACDREMELVRTHRLPPCPRGCDRCIKACPTGSLFAPYAMSMASCVSYLTSLSPEPPEEESLIAAMGSWIYGCDACQEACPFNKGKWKEEEDFPGLGEAARWALPENILSMDESQIKERLSKKFFYIKEGNLLRWKINALHYIANRKRKDLAHMVAALAKGPDPAVRRKALWALEKLKS
jgi:epoxyqueuosine reductase